MHMFIQVIYLFLLVVSINGYDNVFTVELPMGKVQGVNRKSYSGINFTSFKAIPYAKPPVGKLRFKEPVEILNFKSDVDGSNDAPTCFQKNLKENIEGSEDCLYLNVFSPSLQNITQPLLPVIVYIHEGWFLEGSSHLYGPEYFMDYEVVLVTFNYRLGPFGFLSLENELIEGNMGLKDQNMVLKWIQKHIQSFGGNKNSVTIFGANVGGSSVVSHIISRWSKGLFHRGIIHSGVLENQPFHYHSRPLSEYAIEFLESVGCESNESNELSTLTCLQKIDANIIAEKSDLLTKYKLATTPWKEIVDSSFSKKPFFKENFNDALENDRFNRVPILIGSNGQEGIISILEFLRNDEIFEELQDSWDENGPLLLFGVEEENQSDFDVDSANIIKSFYFQSKNVSKDNIDEFVEMLSDVQFISPVFQTAKKLAKKMSNQVWYFNYHYQGSEGHEESYAARIGQPEASNYGVGQLDELILFFNLSYPHLNPNLSEHGKIIKDTMLSYWTEFARTGNPNSDITKKKLNNFKWNALNPNDPSYLVLDKEEARMEFSSNFKRKMNFLDEMIKLVIATRDFDQSNHPALNSMPPKDWENHDEL